MKNIKRYTYTAAEKAEMARDDEIQREREVAFEAQIETMVSAVHPALRATAELLLHEQDDISEAACITFVLEQVAKVGKQAAESAKPELRAIYTAIKTNGGAAYAEHKARLQQLAKG